MIIALAVVVGALFTGGTYLILQRTLTRTILGLVLYGHAVNVLLLLAGGRAGAPPLVDGTDAPIADPLTEAMALTSIVISFGIVAFLLALAYRSWTLTGDDIAEDDVEDRRIAQSASDLYVEELTKLGELQALETLHDIETVHDNEDEAAAEAAAQAAALQEPGGST
jgi:multicomponent Na+:H+ antiporter subunit C